MNTKERATTHQKMNRLSSYIQDELSDSQGSIYANEANIIARVGSHLMIHWLLFEVHKELTER